MGQSTKPRAGSGSSDPESRVQLAPVGRLAALWIVFAALSFAVYWDALSGPFLFDDFDYIHRAYVAPQHADFVRAALDPRGDLRFTAGGNYAPVPLILHAVEWEAWGGDTRGYHAVNVALHALAATLLVALLCAARAPWGAAVVAGALHLLHPANVEAVAWISQLRSQLALVLALAALLVFWRRPLASAGVFGLALLCKASAAFALPMLAAWCWARRVQGVASAREGAALGLWALVLAAYAPLQMGAFSAVASADVELYPDPWTQLRTMAAIGARYLALAATGGGTAMWHEPELARSALDPWWLAGLAAAPLFVWRIAATLRRGSEEAAWWIGAAAGFAPVSQLVPFLYPMADRYLAFVLPGLLGGGLLAGRALLARSAAGPAGSPALRRAVLAASALFLVVFGLAASRRAELWQDEDALGWDSVARYPEGSVAWGMRALDVLERGDRDTALALLSESVARGGGPKFDLAANTRFDPLRDDPRFEELLREDARRRIRILLARELGGQPSLAKLAEAHLVLGEYDAAIEAIERGLSQGGPHQALLVDMLWAAQQRRREAAAPR